MFVHYCSSPLTRSFQEWGTLHLQCLPQCLTYSSCSVNNCWIDLKLCGSALHDFYHFSTELLFICQSSLFIKDISTLSFDFLEGVFWKWCKLLTVAAWVLTTWTTHSNHRIYRGKKPLTNGHLEFANSYAESKGGTTSFPRNAEELGLPDPCPDLASGTSRWLFGMSLCLSWVTRQLGIMMFVPGSSA